MALRGPSKPPAGAARAVFVGALIFLTFTAFDCRGGRDLPPTGPGGKVARVIVRYGATRVGLQREIQLRAIVIDARGREIHDAAVAWASTDRSIAAVDERGRVRGMAIGIASVYASAGGKTGSVVVTVLPVRSNSPGIKPAGTM